MELIGVELGGLRERMAVVGEKPYRATQLFHALYRTRARTLEAISTLPHGLRARLAAEATITWPIVEKQFHSVDGAIRYLLRLADGETIETVLMPEDDRDTMCLSTQVGCAVNCQFCLTALLGLKRNLTAAEIVGQVLLVMDDNQLDARIRPLNLVFMGMGEPLLNLENVMSAVRVMADPQGMGLATRRMTLSTAGIVPKIAEFGREAIRPNLAVSLNATTDEVRTRLIPHNKKWPIAALMEACRRFPLKPREDLSFEYVLLADVNDTDDDARRLVKLVSSVPRAKVNLIALNPGAELPFRTPSEQRVLAFQKILTDAGVFAFIRKPRGRDIFAACGQLKRTTDPERELALIS